MLKNSFLTEPILVGRESELLELQAALNSAFSGKGETIFVSGEAGCGKTRITNEFLEIARKNDVSVLTGWCLSNAAVPYFPFVEAFDSYLSSNEDAALSVSDQLGLTSWLMGISQTEEREKAENVSSQVWKDKSFALVTKELLLMSTRKPVIVVLDDIHWADSASLSLLHYVSRAIRSERILILATFRSEELSAPADGQPHPLIETLRLMGREELFKEIKLGNLKKSDVSRIAESMLGASVHPELAEKLAEESQGNPLFVVESVKMLFENNNLVQNHGLWRLSVDKVDIPTKVKDIILRRVSALKSDQRRILDVASVAGDTFDSELLGAVLNQDSLQVLESLNAISQSNSLVCSVGNFFRFDHAKSREVLYEEIRLPLRRGYHARIAERIESLNQSPKKLPVSDLTYHYAQAGNIEKSIKYALAAGKDAFARFGNTEAIKHFNYVIENAGEISEYADEKSVALEALGSALIESGRQSEAIRVFEQLHDAANSDLVKIRALRKAMFCATYQGDVVSVQRFASKAEGIAPVDKLEHARVRLYAATAYLFAERRTEAVANIDAALRVFEEENSLPDLADALVEAGIIFGKVGRLEESLSAGLLSQALFKNGDELEKVLVYGHLSYVFLASGLYQQAINTASEGIRIGEKIENPRTAWLYFFSAVANEILAKQSAVLGLKDEAALYLGTSIEHNFKGALIAEKTDGFYILSAIYNSLAAEYIMLGDIPRAEEYLSKFQNIHNKFGANMEKSLSPENLTVRAALHTAKGQWAEANDCYEKVLTSQDGKSNSIFDSGQHLSYAKALFVQGRIPEAQKHLLQGQKILQEVLDKTNHASIQYSLQTTRKSMVDQEFAVRLDLINIGQKPAAMVKVENLAPVDFTIMKCPPRTDPKSRTIIIDKLGPFKVESIELSLRAKEADVFALAPNITYEDNNGKVQSCTIKPVKIQIQPKIQSDVPMQQASVGAPVEFEFKTESAKRAFDFLLSSFVEDYMRRRLPLQWSGWRTFNEIVKRGNVSMKAVYGGGGRHGHAISELEHRGLVETRVFSGERGRGGNISKVRLLYEKETIRRKIDERVTKSGKK
jgi:tetratricopeptide (TPR) repeat protein